MIAISPRSICKRWRIWLWYWCIHKPEFVLGRESHKHCLNSRVVIIIIKLIWDKNATMIVWWMQVDWIIAISKFKTLLLVKFSEDWINKSILYWLSSLPYHDDWVVCLIVMMRKEAKNVRIGGEHLWLWYPWRNI